MLLPRVKHYVTKSPMPDTENFLCHCWSKETKWAISIALDSLPELEGKTLLLLKTLSSDTGLGGIGLELTWKAPP